MIFLYQNLEVRKVRLYGYGKLPDGSSVMLALAIELLSQLNSLLRVENDRSASQLVTVCVRMICINMYQ